MDYTKCTKITENSQPLKFMGNMPSSHIKTQEHIDKMKKAQNLILKPN